MTPEELRAIRAEMGDTQAEAAPRYGVEISTYKRWEQGQALQLFWRAYCLGCIETILHSEVDLQSGARISDRNT
jgi:transcriptional regulator with XRE-family HTH domain